MMERSSLLLAATLLVSMANGTALPQGQDGVIDATVCDLVHRPLDFENRHVRVRGIVRQGLELFSLPHDACSSEESRNGSIWLAPAMGSEDVVQYYRGWTLQRFMQAAKSGELKQGNSPVSWQVPSPVSSLDRGQLERLQKVLKHGKARSTQVTIEGRFDFVGDGLLVKQRDGNFSFRDGLADLGPCHCRIVLEQVELER